MAYIKDKFSTDSAEIVLRNQAFVDFIEDRVTGEKYDVMLPEAEVFAFIEADEMLRAKPIGQFYQHTIRGVNSDFKYKDLTLKQLGIPEQDVLYVRGEREFYVQLGSTPHS